MSMFAIGPCGACHQPFSFNPYLVPSHDFGRGRGKEPICEMCMHLANTKRKELGMEPHPILPGAYDPSPTEDGSGIAADEVEP